MSRGFVDIHIVCRGTSHGVSPNPAHLERAQTGAGSHDISSSDERSPGGAPHLYPAALPSNTGRHARAHREQDGEGEGHGEPHGQQIRQPFFADQGREHGRIRNLGNGGNASVVGGVALVNQPLVCAPNALRFVETAMLRRGVLATVSWTETLHRRADQRQ